ncbi:hypothetical protein ACQEV9_45840 [Streptomyces chartreusis]|uniref:hypothetical protein n=1 Tax=Streptomyces chartreusis TaxID=1969 RepID=UPI003D89EE71
MRELTLGPRRFVDLVTSLPGIGTDLLASRLKHSSSTMYSTAQSCPAWDVPRLTPSPPVWGPPARPGDTRRMGRRPDRAAIPLHVAGSLGSGTHADHGAVCRSRRASRNAFRYFTRGSRTRLLARR